MKILAVFAKHWTPGQVKTRLAAAVGDRVAARLARAFFKTTIERLAHSGQLGHISRQIVFAPATARRAFQKISNVVGSRSGGSGYELVQQVSGDLGARLKRYCSDTFSAAGLDARIVIVGSDSPDLPSRLIDQAFDLLQTNTVVLGPSRDGGYYLIGLCGNAVLFNSDDSFSHGHDVLSVFDGIDWGTERVLEQTVLCVNRLQLPYAMLEPGSDVDSIADLQSLRQRLESATEPDPELQRLLRSIKRLVGR